ncbi:unnamed protein product [Microthlaspi erraticum]|uniref:F-box associated beta-propeller type 1 domain-containing protein n=1 Tax=Microthlaspi erraticum TaxID=1685480 RepID=A0A6D2HMZ8_9BRAS|nr:unnamed protein product [Microthlaspi erraticum]
MTTKVRSTRGFGGGGDSLKGIDDISGSSAIYLQKVGDFVQKNRIFGAAAAAAAAARKQFLGFMMMDYKVCSIKFDLQGIRNDDEEVFVDPCIKQDKQGLVVWNPYLGQTKWIKPRTEFDSLDVYALGYDENRNHKILRIFFENQTVLGYEIYDLCSNSWKVFSVTLEWRICSFERGVSLKGNTYFLALVRNGDEFLVCFDFKSESFGPLLPLPYGEEHLSLSCVRDEKLAVLHRSLGLCQVVEIWVTDKIDPSAVSWSLFLRRIIGFPVEIYAGSFFIDEEKKKVAVIFGLDQPKWTQTCRHQTAHIIGPDWYTKSVDIGQASIYLGKPDESGYIRERYCRPLVCSSCYVPSLVQLETNQGEKE